MKHERKISLFTIIIILNFHSFSMISTTPWHKKVHNWAVIHPIGLCLIASGSAHDSASDSIVFIPQLVKWQADFLSFLEKLTLLLIMPYRHGFLSRGKNFYM